MFHDLRQIAYIAVRRNIDFARRRTLQIADKLEDGAFTGPVLAYKPYLVFFTHVKRYVVQKRETAVRYCQMVYRNHLK